MARLTSYDKENDFILVNEEERLLSSKGFITKDEMYKIMRHLAEKLYVYEIKPDMREKVKEYISELDMEIDRCEQEAVNHSDSKIDYMKYVVRLETLVQVKSDLQSRLEEVV